MKITCPACSAEYNVDPSRIPAAGLKMRCPKCSQSFRVTSEGATQSGGGTMLDAGGHANDDARYYVRRPTGKVFGPFDQNALKLMLKSKKLDGTSEISKDKQQWKSILDVPALANAAKDDVKKTMMGMGAIGGGADDDLPTTKGPDLPAAKQADLPAAKGSGGPTDLPAPKRGGGPPDLPAPKKSGPADLPAPKSGPADLPAPKSGPADLPAPKSGPADLPAPKQAGADLPVPKGGGGGAGLPTPKRGSEGDLPTPKGQAGLPTPKGSADLPAPKDGGAQVGLPRRKTGGADLEDLPTHKAGNLPTSKEGNLPTSRGQKDLPTRRGTDELPTTKGSTLPGVKDSELPGRKEGELPIPSGSGASASFEEDLFGDAERDDDDLFGDGGDDDLFGDSVGGDVGDDDLFGAPDAGSQVDDDDLFGTPDDDDDLFGAPSEGEDLFGSPSEAEDDLFAGGDAGGDDFLGGDAGFSFLDDEPQAEPADDWGDDLFDEADEEIGVESSAGLDDWGDDLLDQPAPRQKKEPSEPLLDSDDPFRPASRGIERDEPETATPAAESAHVSKEKAMDSDRKRGGVMMIAVPILAVVVLAGVGYVVYTNFFAGDTTTTTTTKSVGPEGLDVSMLKSDNYSDYTVLLDAASKPKKGEEGKWLLAQSMMLARYPNDKAAQRATSVAKKLENAKEGWEALGRGAWEAQSGNADAARSYLEPLSGADGDIGFFANLMMGVGDTKAVEAEVERVGGPERPAPKREPADKPTPEEESEQDDQDHEAGDGEPAEEPAAEEPEAEEPEAEEPEAGEPPAEVKPEPVREASYAVLVDRARTALGAASKVAPKSPLPHYWKGRLARVIGEKDKASAALEKAIELGPKHVASHVEFGVLSYDRGNLNAAIQKLEKVSGELSAQASNSEKARALHYAGLVHVARRQSDLAIESFTKALSIDPNRSDTLRALAEEYERAHKYKEALNFFTTNKNLGKDDPEVMLGIVRSHMGLEQWNRAIATLEHGTNQFPEDARFPYYLGQLFMKRGAFMDARKPLRKAVEIDSSLLSAHATLAQLAWRMDKDIDAGEEHISRIVEHSDDIDAEVASEVAEYYYLSGRRQTAEEWYREALARDPNHWPARLSLSKLLLEENRQKEAQNLLERAREEGVQDVRLSAYLADAYRQAKDYDRAIDEINKVIEAFPKNEEYVFIRGRIHFDRGNYDTAQKDFQRAYDLNPRFHDAYFFVGRTAFERDDFANALKIFRHVLDYKPDRGDYRYFMARALEAANRTTQALDEYRKATAVDPAYGIENPMVYVYRGRLLSKLNYSKEGKADIARALELAPNSVEARLAMGESEFRDKNYDEAIEHFTKALQLEPARPKAQYRLGMSLLYTDRRAQAAQRLQLAIKHGYDDPEVYKRLGYLYRDLNQPAEAKRAWRTFLKKAKEEGNVPYVTQKEILDQVRKL